MEEPSVPLQEIANHANFEKLPHQYDERAAEKAVEERLHGFDGLEEYLLKEVELRREVVRKSAVDQRAETSRHYRRY